MNAVDYSSSLLAPDADLLQRRATPQSVQVAPSGRKWLHAGIQSLSVGVCILLWHIAVTRHLNLRFVNFSMVPSPAEVARAAWKLLQSPKLWRHLSSSLLRVGFGFGTAAIFGVMLGLLIGRWRWARDGLLPSLEVLRPIPAVAWIPLAILMFPSSEGSMIFITFIGALFPILLNTIHGAETVDPRLIAAARSLGTRPLPLFMEVILPGAAPSIATGLSIGMGTCWFCLVTAEMIAGQYGIGYYTWESYTVQNYANIVVGMLLIGALGMASSGLVRWLMQSLMPWHRPQRGAQ
jgi:NitT/TauT family transport system permease protein